MEANKHVTYLSAMRTGFKGGIFQISPIPAKQMSGISIYREKCFPLMQHSNLNFDCFSKALQGVKGTDSWTRLRKFNFVHV